MKCPAPVPSARIRMPGGAPEIGIGTPHGRPVSEDVTSPREVALK
jgi:hypothetical protein